MINYKKKNKAAFLNPHKCRSVDFFVTCVEKLAFMFWWFDGNIWAWSFFRNNSSDVCVCATYCVPPTITDRISELRSGMSKTKLTKCHFWSYHENQGKIYHNVLPLSWINGKQIRWVVQTNCIARWSADFILKTMPSW